ncbi:MAG: ATP-binding cassette domain-containing protein, partial [Betaproteobacteria bacterium]|nr:ATP-binding cassette domain-containing protein [Betaproteobacteria bacterium]
HLEAAAIGCLLGASGSGKTTVLRVIAGFQAIDHGEIYIRDQLVSKHGRTLAPEQRQVGIVFQDYALFPHLSVLDNVTFGLRKLSKDAAATQALDLLALVGLAGFERRFPHELSGGQQQRAAVARALLQGAKVLLADEPVASLDPESSKRVMDSMTSLCQAHGMTLLVSLHQVHVAKQYCPRIIAMREGQVLLDANQDAFDEAFLSQLYRQQPEEAL